MAERGVCLFVTVYVCLFVSVFVRMITSERLKVGWSNFVVRYIVQKSRPSSKVNRDKKTKTAKSSPLTMHSSTVGSMQQAATDDTIAWLPGDDRLCQGKNQRMLFSFAHNFTSSCVDCRIVKYWCLCNSYYLCQGGYIFSTVCLFVCEQLCTKTSKLICMKFSGKASNGPMNKWLNLIGDPDHNLDTGIVFLIRQYWEIQKVVNGRT